LETESLCPVDYEAKTFIFEKEGGEFTLAFTKEHKAEIVARYENWFNQSQAVYVLSFNKMNMKTVDILRAQIRDAGGEIHVVKNTLFKLVLDGKKLPCPKGFMERCNIVAFARIDPPVLAKLLSDATRNSEIIQIKGGYLGAQQINAVQVKSLADLPPLPVVRAALLGMLQAPASQLARTLAEPARSLAGVFKAYSEREPAPAAAG
jgi:large subunit ribosomal protein L10